jgi:hypothetical protein
MATATAQSEAPADDELLDDDEQVMLEFNTVPSDRPRPTKRFKLDGRVVTATAPKAAAWARMWTAGASGDARMVCYEWFSFVDACLGDKVAAWLRDRERDPNDPYDVRDLVNLVKFLNEQFEPELADDFRAMGVEWQQADLAQVPADNRAARRKSGASKSSGAKKAASARRTAAARG